MHLYVFESLLPDRDLTQKSYNKLSNVHNNNNNVLKFVRKVHQLYTRRTAQLAAGGPVTGQVQYYILQLGTYILKHNQDTYEIGNGNNSMET